MDHKARGIRSEVREVVDLIEAAYGEGILFRHQAEDYRAYERENGRGKGADSGVSDSEVQLQRRTNTLSNREVLSMAAEEARKGDLTAAEKDALDIFRRRWEKLEDKGRRCVLD